MTIRDIRKALRKAADSGVALHSRRFFKTGKGQYGEGDRFLGIRVPVLRQLARQYRGLGVRELMPLLRSVYHEERLLAVLMLVNRFARSEPKEQALIYRLYLANAAYINNWDIVDSSAPNILGAYLASRDQRVLYRLAKSRNLWQRRMAVLATLYFIRQNDYRCTLKIARLLLDDREDLIHKAVGWMLREIGKRAPDVERDFLHRYAARMPRTMLRYAIEKLPAPERKRFLLSARGEEGDSRATY